MNFLGEHCLGVTIATLGSHLEFMTALQVPCAQDDHYYSVNKETKTLEANGCVKSHRTSKDNQIMDLSAQSLSSHS